MCGIFGFSLKPAGNKKAALQKFKILGLYNIRRGRDASGVFVNGEIIKGVSKTSEFDDFIEETIIPSPKENGVMLGHTRQGSAGYAKTIEEAHPFLINDNLVFTHNGTIKNVKSLCDKYRKHEKDFSVDSQALGTIFDEDGPVVLEDYKGAAALAYTYKDTPNTLYIYHGQSKDYKMGPLLEERPLFFMDTKDGIFYSSLEESLEAIKDDEKDEVHNLKYNCIFKITNGKFLIDETVTISRDDANVNVYSEPVHVGKHPKTPALMNSTGLGTVNNLNSRGVSVKEEQLIKRETLPCKLLELKEKKNHLYYHFGRYWVAPRSLAVGPIYIKKGGALGSFEDKTSELCFFWEGVMLQSKAAYMEILALSQEKIVRNWVNNPNESNFALFISKYSTSPVTNFLSEGFSLTSFYRNQWYFNADSVRSMSFTPKYSNGRSYKTDGGFLVNIAASQREKTLYETAEMARTEVEALKRGYLLQGIPGGGSQDIPFPLGKQIEGTNLNGGGQKQIDEIVWFFDIPVKSVSQIMENIGDDEMNSLKEFTRTIFKREFNLTMLDREVNIEIQNMIKEAVDKKCTLMETIPEETERYILLCAYEKAIEEGNKKRSLQSTINFNPVLDSDKRSLVEDITIDSFRSDIEEESDDLEDTLEREQIEDLVENSIIDLENIQITSMELMDAQNSDYAQDCANILITGVNNMLSNMESVLRQHSKTDFVNRVKKIRETKNMADGVL